MQIIHTVAELRALLKNYKQSAKVIAFVPTMGNLHQGHLQLVKMALSTADIVICSIFVNPLQFAEGEDFERYPRTLDTDAEQLEQLGCDIVFAPSVAQMYPCSEGGGGDQTQVVVPGISDILEGASRPGHFTGVATVVTKLFNMVQPDKAIFGAKDYQQLQVIKRFVADLCLPVEILSHPIVREPHGLAMSSRNAYLSTEQRAQAALIYQTISELARQIKQGEKDYVRLAQEGMEQLDARGFKTDYLTIRRADLSLPGHSEQSLVILVATCLGKTRLLDNVQITL